MTMSTSRIPEPEWSSRQFWRTTTSPENVRVGDGKILRAGGQEGFGYPKRDSVFYCAGSCSHGAHLSGVTAAACRWPDAIRCGGQGRYAVIAACTELSYSLFTHPGPAAEALNDLLGRGCGGGCGGGEYHLLIDLQAVSGHPPVAVRDWLAGPQKTPYPYFREAARAGKPHKKSRATSLPVERWLVHHRTNGFVPSQSGNENGSGPVELMFSGKALWKAVCSDPTGHVGQEPKDCDRWLQPHPLVLAFAQYHIQPRTGCADGISATSVRGEWRNMLKRFGVPVPPGAEDYFLEQLAVAVVEVHDWTFLRASSTAVAGTEEVLFGIGLRP